MRFQNWLWRDLQNISSRLTELSDVLTKDNPAWGDNSATSIKNENLIKLYAQYIVEKQKISPQDALCKARFIINNFENGVSKEIQREIRFINGIKFEREFITSDFFRTEFQEKAKSLNPVDVYGPLCLAIKMKIIQKGDELSQNRRKTFEKSDGSYGYECYLKNRAIISKLEQLKIISLKKDEAIKDPRNAIYDSGDSLYILMEDDLSVIRKIIFTGDNEKYGTHDDKWYMESSSGSFESDLFRK